MEEWYRSIFEKLIRKKNYGVLKVENQQGGGGKLLGSSKASLPNLLDWWMVNIWTYSRRFVIKRDGPRLLFWCGANLRESKELTRGKKSLRPVEEGNGHVHLSRFTSLDLQVLVYNLHLHYSYAYSTLLTHQHHRHHIIVPCPLPALPPVCNSTALKFWLDWDGLERMREMMGGLDTARVRQIGRFTNSKYEIKRYWNWTQGQEQERIRQA